MDYMTAKEAAEKWEITPRRVQVLCAQDKIPGAVRFGVTWAIPKDAAKPKDGRVKKSNGNE
ncbi:MAG: helix-turn-helix domain-containing protein [Anaerotignum sp.]|nr:helix-turn-helix domain-containing protein [Anaerotignum sp.]